MQLLQIMRDIGRIAELIKYIPAILQALIQNPLFLQIVTIMT